VYLSYYTVSKEGYFSKWMEVSSDNWTEKCFLWIKSQHWKSYRYMRFTIYL